jgi:hypothetical protein
MSPTAETTHFTVRIDKDLYEEFKTLVDEEERDVSKDVRLHIKRRVEKARRDRAKAAA